MYEAMSDHLILALEALPTLASRAPFYWAEVRSSLRVNVHVRATN